MKIGVIYTGTTPQLLEMVEAELKKQLGGKAELACYADPEILAMLREAGGLTPQAAQKLLALYWRAVDEGAGLIYNCCSSVGDIAHACKPLFGLLSIPVVLIDEEMALAAVAQHSRIGVIATLPTTMDPTCRLIKRCAKDKPVTLSQTIVDAFGLEPDAFAQTLVAAGQAMAGQVDATLLAQGSMAWCEPHIAQATGLPVYSSPRFGAIGVRKALDAVMEGHQN